MGLYELISCVKWHKICQAVREKTRIANLHNADYIADALDVITCEIDDEQDAIQWVYDRDSTEIADSIIEAYIDAFDNEYSEDNMMREMDG